MFLGTHALKLDDKGRMFVPAKYRDELAGGVVIARGQEHCLYVFTVTEFKRIADQLQNSPVTGKEIRGKSRMLFSGAFDQVPDKQGRVSVPPKLREYAGLERDCTVVGNGNHLEIWDSQAWDAYVAEQEDSYSDSEEEVLPGIL